MPKRSAPSTTHWAVGDFSAGADLYDDEVEFVIGPGFPDTGTYLGLEGVLRYTRLSSSPGPG